MLKHFLLYLKQESFDSLFNDKGKKRRKPLQEMNGSSHKVDNEKKKPRKSCVARKKEPEVRKKRKKTKKEIEIVETVHSNESTHIGSAERSTNKDSKYDFSMLDKYSLIMSDISNKSNGSNIELSRRESVKSNEPIESSFGKHVSTRRMTKQLTTSTPQVMKNGYKMYISDHHSEVDLSDDHQSDCHDDMSDIYNGGHTEMDTSAHLIELHLSSIEASPSDVMKDSLLSTSSDSLDQLIARNISSGDDHSPVRKVISPMGVVTRSHIKKQLALKEQCLRKKSKRRRALALNEFTGSCLENGDDLDEDLDDDLDSLSLALNNLKTASATLSNLKTLAYTDSSVEESILQESDLESLQSSKEDFSRYSDIDESDNDVGSIESFSEYHSEVMSEQNIIMSDCYVALESISTDLNKLKCTENQTLGNEDTYSSVNHMSEHDISIPNCYIRLKSLESDLPASSSDDQNKIVTSNNEHLSGKTNYCDAQNQSVSLFSDSASLSHNRSYESILSLPSTTASSQLNEEVYATANSESVATNSLELSRYMLANDYSDSENNSGSHSVTDNHLDTADNQQHKMLSPHLGQRLCRNHMSTPQSDALPNNSSMFVGTLNETTDSLQVG